VGELDSSVVATDNALTPRQLDKNLGHIRIVRDLTAGLARGMRHELCADRVNALTRDPQSGQRSVGGRSWRDAAIRDQRNLVAGLPLGGVTRPDDPSCRSRSQSSHPRGEPMQRHSSHFGLDERLPLLDLLCQLWGFLVASVGFPSSAARSALRAACGDGGAEPSLGGGESVRRTD
jgi:hypothetical protein